jgi:hypothetical protein
VRVETVKPRRSWALPDFIPPAFVGGKVAGVLGGARVGHLRTLIVADAGLEVEGVVGTEGENVRVLVHHEPLGDDDEVAEVAGQFQVGHLEKNVTGDPGAVEGGGRGESRR